MRGCLKSVDFKRLAGKRLKSTRRDLLPNLGTPIQYAFSICVLVNETVACWLGEEGSPGSAPSAAIWFGQGNLHGQFPCSVAPVHAFSSYSFCAHRCSRMCLPLCVPLLCCLRPLCEVVAWFASWKVRVYILSYINASTYSNICTCRKRYT